MSARPQLVRGGPADAVDVLALFDANVAWLAARGREGQWGSAPWTGDPEREAFVHGLVHQDELWRAEVDGALGGVLIIGTTAPPWVQPADEPERYVHLLIADPALRGAGVGAGLLAHARRRADEQGIELLRVDCWAGGDGRLIAYYEGQGFTRTGTFGDPGGFQGQVLELRLS